MAISKNIGDLSPRGSHVVTVAPVSVRSQRFLSDISLKESVEQSRLRARPEREPAPCGYCADGQHQRCWFGKCICPTCHPDRYAAWEESKKKEA